MTSQIGPTPSSEFFWPLNRRHPPGVKGTMNALFLKDLAQKTHRGLRGRVERGKAGGGLCYGYGVVERLDDGGTPVTGERRINQQQAEVIHRVFRDFANGISPRAVVQQLNAEKIPGPGGKLWNATTLRGHAKRGTGLLNNELYIGRLVWNRQRQSSISASPGACRAPTRETNGS